MIEQQPIMDNREPKATLVQDTERR